ncbi:hypothetical protein, partial [Pseudooceanicola sp.]|uniref:hypothetical protein n=1 Tax=Pseudooceanicola sp. TaxID=1914328 RepID=UPI003518BDE0
SSRVRTSLWPSKICTVMARNLRQIGGAGNRCPTCAPPFRGARPAPAEDGIAMPRKTTYLQRL